MGSSYGDGFNDDDFEFSESDQESLLRGIHSGEIDKNNLPENLYMAFAATFLTALYRGFSKSGQKGGTGEQTSKEKASAVAKEIRPLMESIFKKNPEKTGELFDKSHPYFDIPKEDRKLAERNFNLPIPDKKDDPIPENLKISYGYGEAPEALVNELRENVYVFSSAKVYQEVEALKELTLTENGEVITYDEFKDKALAVLGEYNENWLSAEYNTALAEAETARKLSDAQQDKALFPLLRYVTAGDANVSEICAPLDGITLPVDDPFWDSFAPPNHFNCRCVLEQLEE